MQPTILSYAELNQSDKSPGRICLHLIGCSSKLLSEQSLRENLPQHNTFFWYDRCTNTQLTRPDP